MTQAWITWDVRITSKVRAQDNAKKEILRPLPKEVAQNTTPVHVGQTHKDKLKREVQLMRHFMMQSVYNRRFPKICTLVTDLHDRMKVREQRYDDRLRKLAELAFQGVDSPYLDLFSRVPEEFLTKGRLQWRKRPLWMASTRDLLKDRNDDR